ncbi:MAG: hypothetical protein ACLRM8_02210 [Alistipes sp.]
MKFSFHLLLTCIALTACGEGKTTADYRIVPRPGEIAPGDGGIRTGRPHPDRMHRRRRRHARQCGFLAGYVESVVGPKSPVRTAFATRQNVILRADAPGKGGEAYEIGFRTASPSAGSPTPACSTAPDAPQGDGRRKSSQVLFPCGPHQACRIWATGA